MLKHVARAGRAIAVAGLVATASIAIVPGASAAPKSAAADAGSPTARTETRINDLHARLKITPAQEQQWSAFAGQMRENAKEMEAMLTDKSANQTAMNALDDMRAYEKITTAHADALKKLIPAFEPLYNALSPDQKKIADRLFATRSQRAAERQS